MYCKNCSIERNSATVGTVCPVTSYSHTWVLDGLGPNLSNPNKANVDAFPLPDDPTERKEGPMASGVLDYFPNALFEVAKVSKAGNDQHNPGQPLHWSKGKSNDHADCAMRHLAGRGTYDTDGKRHSAKLAWRALALLQEELETERLNVTTK